MCPQALILRRRTTSFWYLCSLHTVRACIDILCRYISSTSANSGTYEVIVMYEVISTCAPNSPYRISSYASRSFHLR
ncbi:hypothetical protein GGR58DRAFT_480793 [Xylaria digitata]|nr:hypothetical protein GGR58DRAFT_480793 [Xylaria digitata]